MERQICFAFTSLNPYVIPDPAKQEHTPGHVDCPFCDLLRDRATMHKEKIRLLPFSAAADLWLESKRKDLKPRTFKGLKLHVKNLMAFFGMQRPCSIHAGHVECYQESRMVNADNLWAEPAGASYIKHELVTLKGILEMSGEWAKIKDANLKHLRMPHPQKPKVMSDEEEMRLFHIAASDPEWQLAYWVLSITCNTGASGCELRNLRFKDVEMDGRAPCFWVNPATAKNPYRERFVEMNATAQRQMKRCMDRARTLGASLPEHYIFPFRLAPGRWDVTRPTTDAWLRRSMASLRKAVNLPWLTPHCLRHQHITLSFEAGENAQSIQHRVGHVSEEMTRFYAHARRDPQKAAVDAIDPTMRFGPRSEGLKIVTRYAAKNNY